MTKKTALVTGASSGIGYVFAERLAKDGYTVTCVARSEDKLKELVAKLGEGHRYIAADLSDKSQLDLVAQDVEKSGYSLLINNAGYGLYNIFTDIPLEDQQNLMFLNMDALVKLSYVYLTHAKSGDALMNVSSALSRLTYPGGATYAGTKGFVTHFTESLWYEYKDKGIYVMALLPGLTFTNFHNVAMGDNKIEIPKGLGYPPEVVVDEGMKALKERKVPSLISGPKFRKLVNLATRLLPRKVMITKMAEKNPIFNK
jgi:short-subunit dehydrogenase